MNRIVSLLFKEAETSDKIEAVKAYVKTIRLILTHDMMVSVRLAPMSSGSNVIYAIKEVRTFFKSDLREAKDMVEQGHTWTDLTHDQGQDLVSRLTKAGATVTLIEQGASK